MDVLLGRTALAGMASNCDGTDLHSALFRALTAECPSSILLISATAPNGLIASAASDLLVKNQLDQLRADQLIS